MQAMQEVLQSLLETAKDKFVTGSAEGMELLQGEARAYRKLLKYIQEGDVS